MTVTGVNVHGDSNYPPDQPPTDPPADDVEPDPHTDPDTDQPEAETPELGGFDLRAAALAIPCPRCEAKVNERCRTLTGNIADGPHAGRWQPLAEAYAVGAQQARP